MMMMVLSTQTTLLSVWTVPLGLLPSWVCNVNLLYLLKTPRSLSPSVLKSRYIYVTVFSEHTV